MMHNTTKPEMAQYLHTEIFGPTTAGLLKEIKQGLLKTWPDLTEEIINKHVEKLMNTTMVHLHMRRQGTK